MKWKNDHSVFKSTFILPLLILLLFAAHLPFLSADPDIQISFSRGPFTDEGLNTIQVRNWVNQGQLDLRECDNLLKTPLLGFPLAIVYLLFGTDLWVSRLYILIMVMMMLALIGKDPKHRGMILTFTLVTMMQYQVFQFSHFSLAEMLSSAMVLMSIHFLARSSDLQYRKKARSHMAIASAVMLSMAYFIKIQFIYLVLLLPLAQLFILILAKPVQRRSITRNGFALSATLLAFLSLYLLAWYLPNREAYDYMMVHQSGGFTLSGKITEHIRFNVNYFFLRGWMQWLVYAFLLSVVAGIVLLKQPHSSRYPVWFVASLSWVLLECHKLTMVYLPTRYQISLFVSMGLLISVVLMEVIDGKFLKKNALLLRQVAKTFAVAIIAILFIVNIMNYRNALDRRTYAILDTNRYLREHLNEHDTVIGAWAPSLTWESRSRALPVWNHFLNFQDPVRSFSPTVIIAETDEQDSEQAYSSQGIILSDLADSTKTITIGQWEVRIYFMKEY